MPAPSLAASPAATRPRRRWRRRAPHRPRGPRARWRRRWAGTGRPRAPGRRRRAPCPRRGRRAPRPSRRRGRCPATNAVTSPPSVDRLRQDAQAVGRELAVVVMRRRRETHHLDQAPSRSGTRRPSRTASPPASSILRALGDFGGGGEIDRTTLPRAVARPPEATSSSRVGRRERLERLATWRP